MLKFYPTYRKAKLLPWLLAVVAPLFFSNPASAQTQGVRIGAAPATAPHPSAMLEVTATDKGMLIPRLDSVQRVQISSPAQGLLVYQQDGRQGFWYYQAPAGWVYLNPNTGGASDNLGNHTATASLNLQGNALTGTGGSIAGKGIGITAEGGLNIGQNTTGNNVFIGYLAGGLTTGQFNQFIGFRSGSSNTSGMLNHFSGYQSGYNNTTGYQNYFSGYNSGYSNTTGYSNYFSGYNSGYNNTTGNSNQFSGSMSGFYNTTGSHNHFDGYNSGRSNTTGSDNYFSGYMSGLYNTTGYYNYFSGYQSGVRNTTGYQNHFSGYNSGGSNTTGIANYFSGYFSGYYNTTGSYNHFDGYNSGRSNTTGNSNYFSGVQSGNNNTDGSYNQFSGIRSGLSNITGNYNWAFGYQAGPTAGNLEKSGAIGYNAKVSISNAIAIGGTGTDAVNVGIGTTAPAYKLDVAGDIRANTIVYTSDARFKQDIRPVTSALAAVQQLRGVRYQWNSLGITHGGKAGAEQIGFLAQELEKIYPELVTTDADGYKAVNYAQLTPVLLEAIKELSKQKDTLENRLNTVQNQAGQTNAELQLLQEKVSRLIGEAPEGNQAKK